MWYKLFVIHILLVTSTDLCCQAQKAASKNVEPKIDEKKLKEIAAIRESLNEAFEKDIDMKTIGRGTVVQPEWTQGSGKSKGSTKVVVTEQKLKAAANIRHEIQSAVDSGTYVKGEQQSDVSQADHYLGIQFRSKNVASSMERDNYAHEQVGLGLEDETHAGLPNVVESSALEKHVDIDKLKQLEMSTRRTREVLILREISEDLTFKLGVDVKEWEHFEHNGQEYFIGLRDADLVFVRKDDLTYEEDQVINVGGPILYLESFSFWNTDSKQQEGLIMIAVDEKVLWYQGNSDVLFWQWSIGTLVNGLKYFKMNQKEYLAISSDGSSREGFPSLNIYQFDLRSREFWIAQKLQLNDSFSEITFLDTGRDAVLAVVQNNSAVIFTFNPHAEIGDHIKFEPRSTIQSEGIESVSAFQMGGYSYLALGGLSPQILHYVHGKFEPKTIFGQNFGLVEMFFPVPARTYRDDLILLVQHRVNFDSHALVVLETLIWDGEAFEATPQAPCVIRNHTFAYGVGCMLDVQREAGIKGSAIINRNNDIFIIVPRHKAESGLYQLKTELLSKNSELLDLKEIFAFLEEWVKEQESLTEEAYEFLQESSTEVGFSNIESIQTSQLEFNDDIGKIFINEYELTEEDLRVDLEDLIATIERLEMELGHDDDISRNRRELTYDSLDFDNVETDELVLQLLNGEKVYLRKSALIFDGDVSFESLKVLNEIRLSSARFARDDSLMIDEDLKFSQINGIEWKNLTNDLVFRNSPLEIEELEVNGEVIVEGEMGVTALNEIRFPDNFLSSSGSPARVVQAEKHFFGAVTVNAVDTGGLINGVNPFDVITLSESQNIPGITAFKQLEVSEKMEVTGTVQGRGLTEFLSNPSLLDSNIVRSACTFRHLEVRGPVLVSEKFNGNNLDTTLSDVVYIPNIKGEKITVQSKKSFNSISFGSTLNIEDNLVSGTPLQSFVPRNTEQDLDLKSISGNVYFNNITVTGYYDAVDVGQLDRVSVNIDGDQSIDAEIDFSEGIWAQSVEILDSLNGQTSFSTLQDDLKLEEALFHEVLAEVVTAECDITGDGTLNNVSVAFGLGHHSSEIYVDELILESGLEVKFLHDINAKVLLQFLEKVDNIPSMILEGKLITDNIFVNGDIQVNKLNDHSFDEEIQMTAIWLNRPNFLQTKLKFQNPLVISGGLKINGSLNEISDFSLLAQDIAFKEENPLIITATKRFLDRFKVMGNADIESVNELSFTEIATKQTTEQFQGAVYINGKLVVENLEIHGLLNDFPIDSFGKSYSYDEDFKSIVLLGEVEFEGVTAVENLYIHGQLNSIGNVNEFFENIVYRNTICMLRGKTTFAGNVTIEKGAYIKHLNGYNVVQLMKNIVFVNDPDPVVISAAVSFKDVIQAKDVTVKGILNATNLMGCFLRDWLADTLRLDRAADIRGMLHFAPRVLDDNSLHAVYLNELDLDYVVTLHTPQNISGHVSFSDVYLADTINTGGLVNGIDLQKEMENTLMINGNQHISTPLTMQTCRVIRSLETNNIINNEKDLCNLANLHENLDFHSSMFFSKVTTNNVITNDLISGIDFDQWHRNSLWSEGRFNMVVSGNWSVKNLYVESPSVIPMGHTKKTLALLKDEVHEEYDQLHEAFAGLCQKSKELLSKGQNRIYFLKHFEKSFSIKEDQNINGVFLFTDAHHKYLIVNIKCESKIYHWDVESEIFKPISRFDSGLIKEIIAVPGKEDIFHFVTNMGSRDSVCSYSGVNSWHFDGEKVAHLRSFNDSDISMIHRSSQSVDKFYAIDERTGKVLQLAPNSTKQTSWNLPHSDSGLYRFLPHDADLGIALANGQQILLLNQPSHHQLRSKRDSLINRQTKYEFKARSETSIDKKFDFSDFRHVIERILRDLIRRLNTQLTDINFVLSEGEFQDEHLQRDFMDILEEIHEQKILPSVTFADLHIEQMEFLSNPVQILAARFVQVIWPVFGEVEEVHSHLRNHEHDHPICSGIFKLLGSAVHDIIQIGEFSKKNQTYSNDATNMTKITSRIQDFQKEILQTIDSLEEESHEPQVLTDAPPSSPEAPIQIHLMRLNTTAGNPLDEPFIGQAITERNLLAADSPYLPARGAGEIVSIKTGMSGNHRTLIAITESKNYVVAAENDSVKIFFDVITGSLFQTLAAYKPNCLTAFNIRDESLLAFVEDKHVIRVLTYKGIRGFVEFVKFKVPEEVSGLNFISVPVQKEYECPRNFMMVSGRNKVGFYELVMAGNCILRAKLECGVSKNY